MYHYWAYGLIVASEMKFPELFPLEDEVEASVVLAFGEVPKPEIHPGGFHFENIEITPSEYRLNVEGIAHYYVANGNRITIKPFEGASEDMVRLYCLSNAFAALLHQRRTIPLHCAALLDNDRLIMIFGESGAGKSTTMAGLLQKGFSPFSDDVCVPVRAQDGEWAFFSSYPMMKFWNSTLEMSDLDLKADRRIRDDMEKYGIYFHDQFCRDPKKPMAIFILHPSDQVMEPVLNKLNGVQLFQELDKNAYRGEYLGATDLKREHFEFFSQLANQVPSYELIRPLNMNSHVGVIQLISEELSKLQNG